MPSKTKRQARFMAACSHGMKSEKCPPRKVSSEFNRADQRTGILKARRETKFKEHKRRGRES